LRKNCLQKHLIEGKIKGRIEGRKEWKMENTTYKAELLVTQTEKLTLTSYFYVRNPNFTITSLT